MENQKVERRDYGFKECVKMEFTNEQKEKILLEEGWTFVLGWCMEYEKPDNAMNVVISVDEMQKFKDTPSEKMWWADKYCEYFMDFDTAWQDYDSLARKPTGFSCGMNCVNVIN